MCRTTYGLLLRPTDESTKSYQGGSISSLAVCRFGMCAICDVARGYCYGRPVHLQVGLECVSSATRSEPIVTVDLFVMHLYYLYVGRQVRCVSVNMQ